MVAVSDALAASRGERPGPAPAAHQLGTKHYQALQAVKRGADIVDPEQARLLREVSAHNFYYVRLSEPRNPKAVLAATATGRGLEAARAWFHLQAQLNNSVRC